MVDIQHLSKKNYIKILNNVLAVNVTVVFGLTFDGMAW